VGWAAFADAAKGGFSGLVLAVLLLEGNRGGSKVAMVAIVVFGANCTRWYCGG
jgi:hypothetical protein